MNYGAGFQDFGTGKINQYSPFSRLPLPDCKMAGYWSINQGGGTRRNLLCPTESHHIEIKVSDITANFKGLPV